MIHGTRRIKFIPSGILSIQKSVKSRSDEKKIMEVNKLSIYNLHSMDYFDGDGRFAIVHSTRV